MYQLLDDWVKSLIEWWRIEFYGNHFFEMLSLFDLFLLDFRDVAQPGSAPRSGRGGRWFESSHPDIYNNRTRYQ